MEILVTQDNNFLPVSLDEVKANLRISNTAQDASLTELIKSALQYWQTQTSYYLTATALKLDIFPEKDLLAPPRQDFLSARIGNLYSPPLAIKIATQKPSRISFIDDFTGKDTQLTPDQLNAVDENFFTVLRTIPLQFRLYQRNTLTGLTGGFYGTTKISLDLVAEGLPLAIEIKQTILRMVASLFENPDVPAHFEDDPFIANTLSSYNCNIGIQ